MVAMYTTEPLYTIVSTNDKSHNNILSIQVWTHYNIVHRGVDALNY